MEKQNLLRQLGLFDASAPRYTSYPPANHFGVEVGRRCQKGWLQAIPNGTAVSLYIHIPFCRRLCWFCACRTQGTKTLGPVENYVQVLMSEVAQVRATIPSEVTISRLHFGGGTPTLLPAATMDMLLTAIFDAFPPADDWEFSVEIDPTEAADDLLDCLAARGLTRASIGVQDFAPQVQEAIGRLQSIDQTQRVTERLTQLGVAGINLDLLYGLPLQTMDSFSETLRSVLDLSPTRLAMYGYAHVPWMSKRQIMIPESALPDTETRFEMAELACDTLCDAGFVPIGIDHFAVAEDGLAIAQADGRLRRNFQGYTDDTAETLIGLGASAISRFPGGYCQNAVATSAYLERIGTVGLAGHRGFEMSGMDHLRAHMIEELMCVFRLDPRTISARFPGYEVEVRNVVSGLRKQFQQICKPELGVFALQEDFYAMARIVASRIDDFVTETTAHSQAI